MGILGITTPVVIAPCWGFWPYWCYPKPRRNRNIDMHQSAAKTRQMTILFGLRPALEQGQWRTEQRLNIRQLSPNNRLGGQTIKYHHSSGLLFIEQNDTMTMN